jgi:hypothetical protein
MLVGKCKCGKTHAANERWVNDMLTKYNAIIPDHEPAELDGEPAYWVNGDHTQQSFAPADGCDCDECRASRRITLRNRDRDPSERDDYNNPGALPSLLREGV